MSAGRIVPEQPKKLVFLAPSKSEPGYLRRQRRVIEAQQRLTDEQTVAAFDAFIDVLLERVQEPVDRDEARELLLDLSEEELDSLAETAKGSTVPLGSSTQSGAG